MSERWLEPGVPHGIHPYHVQIEVTWRCNWRCVHCYQDTHDAEPLTNDDLERLFVELVAAGTLHIIVTGGEPLVRDGILALLASARRRGLGITLYTNAHAITAPVAATLARTIAMAEVSILAGTAEIHDTLCGVRGGFERAWRGIAHLAAAGVDVMIKTPLLRPAIPTFPALAERVCAAGLTWSPDPDIAASYQGATYPLGYRLDATQLTAFYEVFPGYRPNVGRRTHDPGAPEGVCLAGRRYVFVDARGDVYPCLSFKAASDRAEARGEPHARLGNVRTHRFDEIWRAPLLQRVRDLSVASFERCSGCQGSCSPCMAANFTEHGSLTRAATTQCSQERVIRRLPIV